MKHVVITVAVFAALAQTVNAQTTVTIEKVVRSVGNSIFNRDLTLTDPVPGRDSTFLFWSSAAQPPAPVINAGGEVVFKGFSAKFNSINTGGEFGLYVKRPSAALDVLVDTTDDGAGNPTFPVPGHPGFHFNLLEPPLLNNAGDVVFLARFGQIVSPFESGWGFFSTTTTGGPIVKIVDTFDAVAGHTATARFENFTFVSNSPSTFGGSLNDQGQVVYWGQFCDAPPCTSTSRQNGIFGTTVSGASHVLLADSSKKVCPTNIPAPLTCDPDQDQGFWEIRPEIAINNGGIVAFHGGIRRSPPSICCRGTYSIPVTGGVATTVAFRGQTAPPATESAPASTYQDRFDDNEINDSGDYMFLPLLTAPCCQQKFGLFGSDVSGGPQSNVVDTLVGNGLVVPGDIAGAEFAAVSMAPINESGQLGFYSAIRNSGTSNNNGIYAADLFGGPISLVMDTAVTPPGLSAGAKITSFAGRSAVINDDGHMAFVGSGLNPVESGFESLFGLYFYDACSGEVARISDSTTSLDELGVEFGGVTTGGTIGYKLYQSGEARSGKYSSMNNDNQVAFLAKFSNFGMGMYIAHVESGGGGDLRIVCPKDLTLECPVADTSAATTGEPRVCSDNPVTITSSDATVSGCGTTETITRTWTADDGVTQVSCDQVIQVVDTVGPSLTGVPIDETVECGAVPDPASVTATDGCDGSRAVAFEEVRNDNSCPNNYTLIRTWTAADECGNTTTEDQYIGVADTTAPVIDCPPDAVLECPADSSVAANGSATATDNCSATPAITSSDVSVPGPGATETVTRTWTATDDCGQSSVCDQVIEVVDTTAPAVTCSTLTTVLWSPDHNLVPVGLTTGVDDGCDDVTAEGSLTVEVWSDETEIPDTGDGTGRHAPDAKDIDTGLRLRNERRAREEGRVYLIIGRAEDGSGNVGFGTCTVVCPHDQSAEGEVIVAAEAAAAEATVASTSGTTIAEKVAALVAEGWTQHGLSGELGPKQ